MVRYVASECQRRWYLGTPRFAWLSSVRNLTGTRSRNRVTIPRDNRGMEDPEKKEPNATEDYEKKPDQEKNLDRDGGERQPTDHKQEPTR